MAASRARLGLAARALLSLLLTVVAVLILTLHTRGQVMPGHADAPLAARLLVLLAASWALLQALRAPLDLLGRGRERSLGLLALTAIDPAVLVAASWLSALARAGGAMLALAPPIAALTLLGGPPLAELGALLLAVLMHVMLGAALTLFAALDRRGAVRGVLDAGFVLLVIGGLIFSLGSSDIPGWEEVPAALDALGPAAPVGGYQFRDAVAAGRGVACSSLLALLLVVLAQGRLRARFAVGSAGARSTTARRAERRSRPVAGNGLSWLADQRGRRARIQLLATLLVLALGAHVGMRVGPAASRHAFDFEPAAPLAVGAVLLLMVGGNGLWWLQLRKRGLIAVLAVAPLRPGAWLGAATLQMALFAGPVLLLMLGLLACYARLLELPWPSIAAASAAWLSAMALIAVLSMASDLRQLSRRGAQALSDPALWLLFGAPLVFVLMHAGRELAAAWYQVDSGQEDHQHVRALELVLTLVPAGLALLSRRIRALREAAPALLLGIAAPALLYATDSGAALWMGSPFAVLLGATLTLGGDLPPTLAAELLPVEPWVAPLLALQAGLFASLLVRRLDEQLTAGALHAARAAR